MEPNFGGHLSEIELGCGSKIPAAAKRQEMGRATISNGKLLTAAEQAGFNVPLTGDQSLSNEQSLTGRRIAVVAMSVDAIEKVQPGEALPVYCGRFRARKFRQPVV
jgi:hypothetical protein